MKPEGVTEGDLATIREWAARHPEIVAVYLYGSRARGDHRPDSDIDLAIVMGGDDPYSRWFFWIEAFEEAPDLTLEHPVDLQWYAGGAGLERVGPGVERDGVLLYCAGEANGAHR